MVGLEYPKIDTLYDRDDRYVNTWRLRRPEFGIINRWSLTEKIHGMNTRATLFENGDVVYGGKTDNAIIPQELLDYLEKTFTPIKMKHAFWLANKPVPKSATIYGEGYGPKTVAGSGKYRKDVSFRLFDSLVKDDNADWWLERKNLEIVARKLGIKCVPILGTIDFLPTRVEDLQKIFIDSNNRNRLVAIEEGGIVDMIPEGIVATTDPQLTNRKGERVIWKLKIKDFKKE